MYDALLTEKDIVLEIGANIGVLTVPLARRVKRVIAFEPQPESHALLVKNLQINEIDNVEVYKYAIGAADDVVSMPTLLELDEFDGVIGDYGGPEVGFGSLQVEQRKLDSFFDLPKISFIKMDCEGSELSVLIGGEKLINRDRPILYPEDNRPEQEAPMLKWLTDRDYECFWHCPPLYREDNFRKYNDNIFGNIKSTNWICYPKEYKGPRFGTLEPVSV